MTRAPQVMDVGVGAQPIHTTVTTTPEVQRALDSLRPLLPPVGARSSQPFHGRPYEYHGPQDPHREAMERTTDDLEGLQIDETGRLGAESAFGRITAAWITGLVEAAIL